MLRESSKTNADTINLDAVMTGEVDGNIVHADELVTFAEAIVSADTRSITLSREALIAVAGAAAMIDAAGVASNFQRMVRIADSTGITLGRFEQDTETLRDELGINEFATSDG